MSMTSLVKLRFLGQRNFGQGGFVDEKHKFELWGKGEVKEVTVQRAGVLMSDHPDLFVEVKDVKAEKPAAPAADAPSAGDDEKAKNGLPVKNKQAEAPKAEK